MRQITKAFFLAAIIIPMGSVIASPWPVGTNDEATAIYRTPTWISVIKNDIGDNLYISEVNTTSKNWGRVSVNADKTSVTYTSANATEDEFWYVLKDDQGRTNAAKVVVSISDNIWPIATSDSAKANYNEAITIPVLNNDSGTELKLVSVNEWSTNQGKVSINANNELSYKQYGEPRGDQTDTFWYVFEDKWGRKNAAEVTVSLKEVNASAWPTATADFAEATSGVKSLIRVLDNDIGTGLTLKSTNDWTQNGGRTVIADGVISYTPPTNYLGVDAFWYVFEDNQGRANSAKVEVEVTNAQGGSVIEYCGNNYETDGTQENTSITNLTPTPSTTLSTAVGAEAFEDGQGRVNGRRYYIEGTVDSGQSLWVEVAGVVSKLDQAAASQAISIVGAHTNKLLYVNGNTLFAHNGTSIRSFGNLLTILGKPIINVSAGDHTNTAIWEKGLSDDFFFSVNNRYEGFNNKTFWRISGGALDTPVKLDSYAYTSGSGYPIEYISNYSDFYFYNGLDYFVVEQLNFTGPNLVKTRRLLQRNTTAFTGSVSGVFDRYTESAGRLFITMSPWILRQPGSVQFISGNLYAIDKQNGDFVEVASCETGHVEF